MKHSFNKYLLNLFILFFCVNVFAQTTPPKPNYGAAPPPPPGLPIDNWVPFFVSLGVIYAVYVLKFKAKKMAN